MTQRIQIQLESSLAELRDYEARHIFTSAEIQAIVQRRTHFEQALTRRDATEADYWAYYDYTRKLEQLRVLRTKREKKQRKVKTVADWALQKAALMILRRGIRRFPKSTQFWHALLHQLRSSSPPVYSLTSKAYMGYIAAGPTHAERWIEAAQYEFEEGDVAVARKLLMRAVRFLPASLPLWQAWINLEVEYASRLKKRWQVLGVMGEAPDTEVEGIQLDFADDSLDGLPVQEGMQQAFGDKQEQNAVIDGEVIKVVLTHALDSRLLPLLRLRSDILQIWHLQIQPSTRR
jgi:tetratricopeptide (TPR) repeat protein